MNWLRGVWLRDRPCPEVGEGLRAKLDAMARQSRPPRVTAPAVLRDDSGRIVAEVPRVMRRPCGNWDSNCDARRKP